jgi:hypothetical protein
VKSLCAQPPLAFGGRVKFSLLISVVLVVGLATGCAGGTTLGDSVTEDQLEAFFRAHKVEGNHVAAIKKRSAGVSSYLATIHGYPNNISVCEEIVAPLNKDDSTSVVPGQYYCEELR